MSINFNNLIPAVGSEYTLTVLIFDFVLLDTFCWLVVPLNIHVILAYFL